MSEETETTAKHVVGPGDHIARIAAARGFRKPGTIWDDGGNATIKQQRVNPHTLAPGDTITIPTRDPFSISKPTDAIHRLVVASTGVLLNLKLEDVDRKPLANRFYRLVVGERSLVDSGVVPSVPVSDVTDPKGFLSQPISVNAAMGELTVHEGATEDTPVLAKIRLLIGALPPPNTIRGVQARLNNMGYFAGFSDTDTDQLTWAVEEFEHDHGMKPTGKFDDPKVFNRIAHEHGDFLPNEKAP